MSQSNSTIANPYRHGGPIKEPEWFFGRTEQRRIILDRLRKFDSTSVIGERRSGKTSLLLWLMNREADPTTPSDDSIYIYLSPEMGVGDPDSFTEEVFRALREQDCTCPEPSGRSPSYFALRRCVARLAPRKLVILLDEFDTMVMSGLFPMEFFASLRGLAQTHDVSYVTTTREDLFQCCPEEVLASPFPNIFRPAYIGSFEANEFDDFIAETSHRSGVSLESCKQHVLSLGGRYPFFVQIACCHCFELLARGDPLDAPAHEQIQTSFEDEAQRHMTVIWDRYLSDDERETMRTLCQGQYGDPSVLHELTRKGYVVDGRIFSSLLEKMARQQLEAAPGQATEATLPRGHWQQGVWLDDSGDVWVEGQLVDPPLTHLEYSLLHLLYENRGRICAKYHIIENVWSDKHIDVVGDSRIAKLVDRLREKVEPEPGCPRFVLTVHGRGYRLATPPENPAGP
jgi:hypothetical protein